MISRRERIEGGLLGLLIGDALGVPDEFHPPDQIPRAELIEMSPPLGFSRAHPGVPLGTWSDDGAQALCLLDSLLHKKGLDLEDLGRRMLDWYEHGYLAVDGKVFDVGVQTSSALLELRAGTPALKAGRSDERANGNGSLMRVLPLALWHAGPDEVLASD
ncbi:MAG: ADP-ribosylglycohydrolase family protein, partial [Deltaproteobacteria bacterium]|nr:ADP-ribosylglycohydrolase family protein [Deltaproteobacteria bacterium]